MDKINNNVVTLRLRTNLLRNRASLAVDSKRFPNIVASGCLATLLFFVTVFNSIYSSQSETRSSRGIASVDSMVDGQLSNWDKNLLKRIAQKSERKLASISNKATEIDQLRFGLLEGKYSLKMEDGKISELLYHDAVDLSERPKYVPSKDEFLSEYKNLLKGEFTSATLINEKVEDGKVVENYRLIGPQSSPVATAKFISDQYGRLISLRIE